MDSEKNGSGLDIHRRAMISAHLDGSVASCVPNDPSRAEPLSVLTAGDGDSKVKRELPMNHEKGEAQKTNPGYESNSKDLADQPPWVRSSLGFGRSAHGGPYLLGGMGDSPAVKVLAQSSSREDSVEH